jgi:hypothetical protein
VRKYKPDTLLVILAKRYAKYWRKDQVDQIGRCRNLLNHLSEMQNMDPRKARTMNDPDLPMEGKIG